MLGRCLGDGQPCRGSHPALPLRVEVMQVTSSFLFVNANFRPKVIPSIIKILFGFPAEILPPASIMPVPFCPSHTHQGALHIDI